MLLKEKEAQGSVWNLKSEKKIEYKEKYFPHFSCLKFIKW